LVILECDWPASCSGCLTSRQRLLVPADFGLGGLQSESACYGEKIVAMARNQTLFNQQSKNYVTLNHNTTDEC
jgi:hypothetical protein